MKVQLPQKYFGVRLTTNIYNIAKENAKKKNMHVWEWVAKAIVEQDLLEKLVK